MSSDYSGWGRPTGSSTSDDPTGIVLIGRGLLLMTQTWAHIEMEFRARCVQVNSLEALAETQQDLSELRFVIVDQEMSEDLLTRWDAYRSLNPDASIVLAYRDPEKARKVLLRARDASHSCLGFLPIDVSLDVLVCSMRMLLHRQYFLPRSLLADWPQADGPRPDAETGQGEGRENGRACFDRLTSREREVLRFVSEGESNKVIARRLGITEHTVKLHIHNLSGKLGTTNRTAAAKLYFAARNDGRDVAR